jgi:hypothetical protein
MTGSHLDMLLEALPQERGQAQVQDGRGESVSAIKNRCSLSSKDVFRGPQPASFQAGHSDDQWLSLNSNCYSLFKSAALTAYLLATVRVARRSCRR